jgi:hypothetical protein
MSLERKELIHNSIECMSDILAGRTFDYITVNWVFHHLVGNSYRTCRNNCLDVLIQCKKLLKPNGKLIVAENMFTGYLRSNLPSHIIYAITSARWPWFVRVAKRFFNTAGVGVCFQSQRAWQHIFVQAGFDVVAFQQGSVWWWVGRSVHGMAYHLLLVKSVSHGHFFLRSRPNPDYILFGEKEHGVPLLAKMVNRKNTALKYAYIADGRSLWHRLSALARSSPHAVLRPREKALMPVIVLCSLGLWWAIWLAVTRLLASAWLWFWPPLL